MTAIPFGFLGLCAQPAFGCEVGVDLPVSTVVGVVPCPQRHGDTLGASLCTDYGTVGALKNYGRRWHVVVVRGEGDLSKGTQFWFVVWHPGNERDPGGPNGLESAW